MKGKRISKATLTAFDDHVFNGGRAADFLRGKPLTRRQRMALMQAEIDSLKARAS